MKLRPLEANSPDTDLTPIIDIVFLLLMLFMIVINFENSKAEDRTRLPTDGLAKPPEVRPEHELVLNFGYKRNRDGSKAESAPTVYFNDRDVEVGRLGIELDQERRALEQQYGKRVIGDVTVLIRADADVPAGLVQQLVQKCQQNGFTKFLLRAMMEQK